MVPYRRDIDGLRALAVIPVVAFHAAPELVPGGFVGVDIFFVISGFLITSILADQLERGSFSVMGFYERRVRRILPALCACVGLSAVTAVLLLPPEEMTDFGKSLVSVVLFSSNVFFWRQGGYFAGPAHEKPLLHTWSLSVEEQFYLVWPILLAFLFRTRARNRIGLILVLLSVLSLAATIFVMGRDAEAAFYLAPLRAWELGLGAFLAVGATATVASRRVREVASALGLCAIIVSMFAYSSETPFPGIAALLPCGGAALIIYANRDGNTFVRKLLSLEVIVFIGLISYSLYLWHWPILVFSDIGLNRALMPAETIVAVGASFAAAVLSWRYVEQPFRKPREQRPSSRLVFGSAFASLAVLGSIGLAAYFSHGLQFRASAAAKQAEASAHSVNPLRKKCHVDGTSSNLPPLEPCISDASASYRILIWGDSHADHFVPAIANWAGERGLSTRQATKSACRPLLSSEKSIPDLFVSADCESFNQAVVAEATKQPNLNTVIVSGYWASTAEDAQAAGDAFRRALSETIGTLRRRLGPETRILVVGTTPVFEFWATRCLARAALYGRDGSHCALARPINEREAATFDPIIAEVGAEGENVTVLRPWRQLCSAAGCATVRGKTILYRDHSHFTVEGSRAVLAPLLEGIDLADGRPNPLAQATVWSLSAAE